MTNYNKYILLYTIYFASLFTTFFFIDDSRDRNIQHQQNILIKQAKNHFQSQSSTREWNDQYLGVYVHTNKILKPHPYLPNNIVISKDSDTLYRVNHASMARQLSEISSQKDFKFHLTSLNPLNPLNKAGEFEKRALEFIEKNKVKEYYEFNDNSFRYLGAILTEKKCLECHAHQGYNVGDVRGGLSVTLNKDNYTESVSEIESRNIVLKVAVFLFLSLIAFLMTKQIQSNQILVSKVAKRTKEINETKELLQNVLDADLSLMIVSTGTEIILANKTTLDFLEVPSLEKFKNHYTHISDVFENYDEENYLQANMNGEHWIEYLQREQHNKTLKVMIKKGDKDVHLKVHSNMIQLNNQDIHIIIFDDITDDLETINNLKDEASKDTLTNLSNRRKLNEVLAQEMVLSQSRGLSLSVIFLDIDHFKVVNDTYGHDIGDEVLIKMSQLLLDVMRVGDFVARWGGEEFIVTLQATTASQAALVAEKIRQKVQDYDFGIAGQQKVSLGVTQYEGIESKEDLLKRADEALYEAKETGRNKVVVK